MADVLLTWELGAGMGHVVQLRVLADALIQRGHRVTAAVQDLMTASRVFQGSGVRLMQAPYKHNFTANEIRRPVHFGELLHNIGFNQPGTLYSLVDAWRAIIEFIRPDIMICDYSPTAIVAGRALQIPRLQLGCGFCCTTPDNPFPSFASGVNPDTKPRPPLRLLENTNHVLESMGCPVLDDAAEILGCDGTLLATFSELDHYGHRADQQYLGVWTRSAGGPVRWRAGSGKRIFCYLKDFPKIESLVAALASLDHAVLIYGPSVPTALLRKYDRPHIQVEYVPPNIDLLATECDLAILHGSPASVTQLLLAGVPCMQLPLHMEHYLLSRRLVEIGAGVLVPQLPQSEMADVINQSLHRESLHQSAQNFAERYKGYDMAASVDEAVDRIENTI